jgi:hypothetical protein
MLFCYNLESLEMLLVCTMWELTTRLAIRLASHSPQGTQTSSSVVREEVYRQPSIV